MPDAWTASRILDWPVNHRMPRADACWWRKAGRQIFIIFLQCVKASHSTAPQRYIQHSLETERKQEYKRKRSERQTDIHTQAVGEKREWRKHLGDGDLGVQFIRHIKPVSLSHDMSLWPVC